MLPRRPPLHPSPAPCLQRCSHAQPHAVQRPGALRVQRPGVARVPHRLLEPAAEEREVRPGRLRCGRRQRGAARTWPKRSVTPIRMLGLPGLQAPCHCAASAPEAAPPPALESLEPEQAATLLPTSRRCDSASPTDACLVCLAIVHGPSITSIPTTSCLLPNRSPASGAVPKQIFRACACLCRRRRPADAPRLLAPLCPSNWSVLKTVIGLHLTLSAWSYRAPAGGSAHRAAEARSVVEWGRLTETEGAEGSAQCRESKEEQLGREAEQSGAVTTKRTAWLPTRLDRHSARPGLAGTGLGGHSAAELSSSARWPTPRTGRRQSRP